MMMITERNDWLQQLNQFRDNILSCMNMLAYFELDSVADIPSNNNNSNTDSSLDSPRDGLPENVIIVDLHEVKLGKQKLL